MNSILFSLILATIERERMLERFLESLDAQTYRNFELIVVDQNLDDRIKPILNKYRGRVPLTHLHSSPGLSHARNVGLKQADGGIVTFPDDDCWYPANLFEKLNKFFENNSKWDGVLGKLIWKERLNQAVIFPVIRKKEFSVVNNYNATTSVHSVTLFLKREALHKINGFDEKLGLGAGTPWGGGADIDLTVRCLKAGFQLCYNPEITVYHPNPRKGYTDTKRGFKYGRGLGKVLSEHQYPIWFILYHLLRSLSASMVFFISGQSLKSQYYWAVFRGKFIGWYESSS